MILPKGELIFLDQRIGTYTTNTAARRWTMSVFSYLLDTARVNSQTLWALNSYKNPKLINSFQLATDLISAHIKKKKIPCFSNKEKILNISEYPCYDINSSSSNTDNSNTWALSSTGNSSTGNCRVTATAKAVQVAAAEAATPVTATSEPAVATSTAKKRCIKCIEIVSSLDVTERKRLGI